MSPRDNPVPVLDEELNNPFSEPIVSFQDGKFVLTEAPEWWHEDDYLTEAHITTSLEVGPFGCGVVARRAPAGFTVCLIGNEERQDVRTIWCRNEADYIAFLCGPGAAFVSACALILNADPLKKGTWR